MQKNEMMNLIRKAKDRDPDAFTTLMQQKELTDKGAAVVLKEQKDYSKLAVTDNGITITPETIIVDENFAHIAFSVKGYDLAEGDEPGFDDWNIGVKDGKEGSSVQAYGGFYDGIVSDEDGNLEYVASIGVADWKDSLLGKTIVCKLKDLGTLYKTRFTLAKEGNWDFEIKLPDVSTASNIKVAKGIENTPFTVDDVELSPISIKINYSVNGEVMFKEDTNQVPQFFGVILKDGKKISFLGDAGGTGYNEAMTEAYTLSSFVQVIEPDQVQVIILRNDDGEQIEIPIR